MFERKNIENELLSFIESTQFENFKIIMDDFAASKFMEIQTDKDDVSHAAMIANRKVLNFYINLPKEIMQRKIMIEQNRRLDAERVKES